MKFQKSILDSNLTDFRIFRFTQAQQQKGTVYILFLLAYFSSNATLTNNLQLSIYPIVYEWGPTMHRESLYTKFGHHGHPSKMTNQDFWLKASFSMTDLIFDLLSTWKYFWASLSKQQQMVLYRNVIES